MTQGLIWVTRTAPFNRLTAKRLVGAGHDALCAPVLRVVPVPAPPLMAVPDALVFTSLNGVRLHRFSSSLAAVPVFAVGDHSARYARARGYRRVTSASGNLADLARAIRNGLAGPANILHVGAATPAGDLATLLGSSYRVARLPVYGVEERDPREFDTIADRLGEVGHILIHSPRAGHFVARWLAAVMPDWPGAIHCISPAAAEPFGQLPGISRLTAGRPDERSLLATFVRSRDTMTATICGFDRSGGSRHAESGEMYRA
jgi:uroporphyrinogen-III synthase